MASKLAQLREQRAEIARQASALNDSYPSDQRMPRADADKLDRLLDQIRDIDRDIEAESEHASSQVADDYIAQRAGMEMRTPKDFRRHYLRNATFRKGSEIDLGDFVRGVAGMPTTDAVRNSLSVGTDTAGGYLVPSIVMPKVLEAMVPLSAVMTAGAAILPLDLGAKTFTQVAVDTIPTAAWRNEGATVATSDPVFRAAIVVPKSLSFQFKLSRELLQDASNIEPALMVAIGQSFAKELDRVALRGSGTSPEPRGLLNTTNVGAVTNGANGTVIGSYANFFTAAQTILQADGPLPTAAIMSPRSLVKFGDLKDTSNQPLQVPTMLKDMRMLSTSQVPNNLTVGSSTDCSEIYFGDFTRVRFAMREQISIQVLNQLYAGTGEIGFMAHMRADVLVDYPKAFAVATGVR